MKKQKPDLFSNHRFRELVDEFIQGDIDRQLLIRFYVDDKTIGELENEFHLSDSAIGRKVRRGGRKIFQIMEEEYNRK